MSSHADRLQAEKAELLARLELLAAETRDPALRRAARAIRQCDPGRTPFDDERALSEARWSVKNGEAKSLNAAFRNAARTYYPDDEPRAVVERLRRKNKLMNPSS